MNRKPRSAIKTSQQRQAVGVVLFLIGMLAAVVGPYALLPGHGSCTDLYLMHGGLLARLSQGPSLPVPVIEQCGGGLPIFLGYYAGFLIASLGALMLICTEVRRSVVAVLAILGVGLALVMPFMPTTDPYTYAMYAYETHVLRQSPYLLHHFDSASPVAATLNNLFTERDSPIRAPIYGPLFMAIYGTVVGPLSAISLKAMILGERIMGAVFVVLLALATGIAQRSRIEATRAFAAIMLNPLVLFESVSFAHGDIVMLVLLAIALVLYYKRLIGLCAILCAAAASVRIPALAASLVLAHRFLVAKRYRELGEVTAATLVVVSATWWLSERAFGVFRVGGISLFMSNWDAPLTAIVSFIFGASVFTLIVGTFLQLGAGCLIGFSSLRDRAYSTVPVAVLVALPVLNPWYAQWLSPIAAITRNGSYRASTIAFMLLAPLVDATYMVTGGSSAFYRASIVIAQWLIPLGVYGLWRFYDVKRSASQPSAVATSRQFSNLEGVV